MTAVSLPRTVSRNTLTSSQDTPKSKTGGPLVFRAESDFSAAEGTEISIAMNTEKLNWFDRQTGENLLKEKS